MRIRSCRGGKVQPEGGGDRANDIHEWVLVADAFEKWRADLAPDIELGKFDVDGVGNVVLPKEGLDVRRRVMGSRRRGGPGDNANVDGQGTDVDFPVARDYLVNLDHLKTDEAQAVEKDVEALVS